MSVFARNIGTSSLFRRARSWIQPVLFVALLPGAAGYAGSATAAVRSPAEAAPVEQYMRRVWRIQDGLPEDTVQAIQQSQDGYLWIGTTGGLVQFDGSHFRLYDHATTPALAEAAARSEVDRLTRELALKQAQLDARRTEPAVNSAAAVPALTPSNQQLVALAGGVLLLGLAGGFWLGYATLARRVRRKFGGIRVY